MSDKLKNVWKQIKSAATIHIIDKSVVPQVKAINKEMKTRANKAPWYKEPTYQDLTLAYKDAAKINKSKKKK
mgnify:CR=1 FL=1|jgi:hypothetical protein|tara:strand:- start:4109 stop:4324 length:216 start_codon:yes stop_codon:yes gene_type:complete